MTVSLFVFLVSSSPFSSPDGNFERGGELFWEEREDRNELGDAPHTAAALQESGIECETRGRDRRLISSGDDS